MPIKSNFIPSSTCVCACHWSVYIICNVLSKRAGVCPRTCVCLPKRSSRESQIPQRVRRLSTIQLLNNHWAANHRHLFVELSVHGFPLKSLILRVATNTDRLSSTCRIIRPVRFGTGWSNFVNTSRKMASICKSVDICVDNAVGRSSSSSQLNSLFESNYCIMSAWLHIWILY